MLHEIRPINNPDLIALLSTSDGAEWIGSGVVTGQARHHCDFDAFLTSQKRTSRGEAALAWSRFSHNRFELANGRVQLRCGATDLIRLLQTILGVVLFWHHKYKFTSQ